MPDLSKLSVQELRDLEEKIAAERLVRVKRALVAVFNEFEVNPMADLPAWDPNGKEVTIQLS